MRSLIELVRPHVDEVVLAVHQDAAETIESCRELVDKLLVHAPLDGASQSALVAWMLHHCNADWILRLDDDELPSAELLEALPTVIADRRTASAVALKRRWVYPDAAHWIADSYWGIDYLTRLLRNLPSLWSFSGDHHAEGRFLADRATVGLPFYHLDLVLSGPAERRLKRDEYERVRPGLSRETFPLNDQYLPELHEPLTLAAVPPEDRAPVASLLDPPPLTGSGSDAGAPPAVTPLREIIRHNGIRQDSGPELPQGRVSFVNPRREIPAGTECAFDLEVVNSGTTPWPFRTPIVIRAGTRWLTPDGKPTLVPEGRTHFSQTIWPGLPARVVLFITSPSAPGRYLLEADLVHEGVRWFGLHERTEVEVVGGSNISRGVGRSRRVLPLGRLRASLRSD